MRKAANGMLKPRFSELPCEIASREILPSIRAALVRFLVEEKHYSKYMVAKMLGLTPASITYYMRGARGNPELERKLLSDPTYRSVIEKMADIVVSAWEAGRVESAYSQYRNLVCSLCSWFNPAAREAGCTH